MAHLLTKEKMHKKAEISPEVQKFIEEVKTINKYKHPDRTQRLKDILRDKFTSCWGISRLALNRLRKAKLDPETVFIYEDDVSGLPTHQFTTFKDGKKYRVHDYWFNNREQIGDAFSTREEAIDDRVKRWRQEENHFNPVHVYTGTHLPKPGVDSPEYMYRIMNLAKLLKTYPKMEKESSANREQDKYTIHGAILGCLGNNANKFKYNVTEDLPNDPWKAIINTGPITIDKVRQFHKYHKVDVDKAGVPYYFLTRNERTGQKAVWYSDSPRPIPINNKKEIALAKTVGLMKGLIPEQLDFKF